MKRWNELMEWNGTENEIARLKLREINAANR